jgi:hypothetical protein
MGGAYRLDYAGIAADIMINTIANFGRELANDPDLAADYEYAQMINILNQNVATNRPVIQQEVREIRKAAAVAETDNHADAVNKYFDTATVYTSNGQNVHDSKVNGDLRSILRSIKSTSGNIDPKKSISNARRYIYNDYQHEADNAEIVKNAITSLDRAAQAEHISTFNETEDRIFAYVWERSNHPRNGENSDLMKEAIINALADGVENGKQVCINGRCARLLGSMTTLDFDRNVADGVMTYEAYRNQIFQEAGDVFNQEFERISASDDPDDKQLAAYLADPDKPVNQLLVDKFIADIKLIIDRNIDTYRDKFSADEIEAITAECYTAVEI